MKQPKIKANHTYSGGKEEGRRKVLEWRRYIESAGEIKWGKYLYYYQISGRGGGGYRIITLKSFAAWAKEER